MKGINVKAPWAKLISSGAKTIETRNYPCPNSILGKPILLIETPLKLRDFEARGIAVVKFVNTFEYSSIAQYIVDKPRHLVDEKSQYYWNDRQRAKYGWQVQVIEQCSPYIVVPKYRGIVWTSPIDVITKQL